MNLSDVIRSAFSADLIWRKEKHAPLLGAKETLKMKEKYKDVKRDMCNVGYLRTESQEKYISELNERVKMSCQIVFQLLNLFPDNLFLCGGSVLTQITGQREYCNGDWDIFFVGCDIDRAEEILKLCLEFIQQNESMFDYDNRNIYFSQGCVTTQSQNGRGGWHKLQFIRRIYQEPSQILLGFDIWACQHGWNPKIGYFTIPTGALSLAINAFPIDLSKRSLSYGHRLMKYYRDKNFDILLPGIDTNIDHDIETPDGTFVVKCANGFFRDEKIQIPCTEKCPVTIFRMYHATFCGSGSGVPYDYETTSDFNIRSIEKGLLNLVTIVTKKIDRVFSPSLDKIEVKELHEILSNKEKRWRTKNPGSQSFGIFNPVITNPKDWYNFDRSPYYIGIHPNVYVKLRECWKFSNTWKNVTKDVFLMICDYVMFAESQF